jgi:hypothetical protein
VLRPPASAWSVRAETIHTLDVDTMVIRSRSGSRHVDVECVDNFRAFRGTRSRSSNVALARRSRPAADCIAASTGPSVCELRFASIPHLPERPRWDHYRIPWLGGRPSPTCWQARPGRGVPVGCHATGGGPVPIPDLTTFAQDRQDWDMSRVFAVHVPLPSIMASKPELISMRGSVLTVRGSQRDHSRLSGTQRERLVVNWRASASGTAVTVTTGSIVNPTRPCPRGAGSRRTGESRVRPGALGVTVWRWWGTGAPTQPCMIKSTHDADLTMRTTAERGARRLARDGASGIDHLVRQPEWNRGMPDRAPGGDQGRMVAGEDRLATICP